MGGASADAECLIVTESASLPPHSYSEVGDFTATLFEHPLLGDFHLQDGALAVDFCDSLPYTPTTGDMDRGLRGLDAPVPPYFPGATYDLGADEWGSEKAPIFRDGFETGNLFAWSATAP